LVTLVTEQTTDIVLVHTGHFGDGGHERDGGRNITHEAVWRSALLASTVCLRRIEIGDKRGPLSTRIGPPRSMGDGDEDEGVGRRGRHSRYG
jgi:hypothetical protein